MATQGGGNLLQLYTVTNTTGGVTIGTTPIMTFNQIEGTTFARNDQNGFDTSLAHIQDEQAFYDFLDTYAPASESGTSEEVTFEDGTTYGGSTSSSPDLLLVHYGALDENPASTSFGKRKVFVNIVKVSSASGAYTTAANTQNRPTFETVGQKFNAIATISTILNTSKVAAAQTITVPANSRGVTKFLNKQA